MTEDELLKDRSLTLHLQLELILLGFEFEEIIDFLLKFFGLLPARDRQHPQHLNVVFALCDILDRHLSRIAQTLVSSKTNQTVASLFSAFFE